MTQKLTHLNAAGDAHMVDIRAKAITHRTAIAYSEVIMQAETLALIQDGKHKKGDVIAVARIAGIQAAKKCSDLIPLCHPLMLTKIAVEIHLNTEKQRAEIHARCELDGKTGVEMEALTAASVAALTLYDMCKAVDKKMIINATHILSKTGGKSWPMSEESG